jgi:hypothetical protein
MLVTFGFIAFQKECKLTEMLASFLEGGENMSKQKNKKVQHNPAMPKTDVEFAHTGLEKVALKAQERQHNK